MEAKKQIFHNQHEKWCLNVALPFCGKVIRHRAFRQHLVVDAQIRLDRPLEIWADLSPYLVARNTLIEHFSNSVSLACFASSQEKIFHALKIYESRALKDRGDERSPSLVVLSHRQPDKLLNINGLFEPMGPSGLWVKGPLDFGTTFLVVTSRLPSDPRYDWLRMSTRVPKNASEYERATALIRSEKMDRMTQKNVSESVMELMINGKTPFDLQDDLDKMRDELAKATRVTDELKMRAEEEKRRAEERVNKLEMEVEELRRQLAEKK